MTLIPLIWGPLVTFLALSRSAFLQSTLATLGAPLIIERNQETPPWIIQLPLEPCTGGCVCVRIKVQGERIYRAAVDTGSPYLVLSGNQDSIDDSNNVLELPDSMYPPTEEMYGSTFGMLQWKKAQLEFRSFPKLSSDATILGQMDGQLNRETGGTLLGLVQHPNPTRQQDYYRPTWLEQVHFKDGSKVTSFSIDDQFLTLSNKSLMKHLVPKIPLIDLRPLGEYVDHYNCRVEALVMDGKRITSRMLGGRPIVAVLDTGLTGCLFAQPFWDALTETMEIDPRRVKEMVVQVKGVSNEHGVEFISGRAVSKVLFYVAPISLDWFYEPKRAPFLIILGQAFLSRGKLTIDTEDRLGSFEVHVTDGSS
jgi:hypothetical protein